MRVEAMREVAGEAVVLAQLKLPVMRRVLERWKRGRMERAVVRVLWALEESRWPRPRQSVLVMLREWGEGA